MQNCSKTACCKPIKAATSTSSCVTGAPQHQRRMNRPMLLNHTAKGVYAIAVTPFKPDGAVDYDSVDRMTDFYLGCGVTGPTILGIMGEAPKLDPAEALAISNQIVRRAEVPIIVGVSAPGFAAMRSLARSVMEGGAAGVMIAPPPSLRTEEQIVGYFRQAVEAIGPDVPW